MRPSLLIILITVYNFCPTQDHGSAYVRCSAAFGVGWAAHLAYLQRERRAVKADGGTPVITSGSCALAFAGGAPALAGSGGAQALANGGSTPTVAGGAPAVTGSGRAPALAGGGGSPALATGGAPAITTSSSTTTVLVG